MREERRRFLKISGASALALLHPAAGQLSGYAQARSAHPPAGAVNDKIRAAYELGLSILKPSRNELEHGLELHRSSLVFDAYGFMPRSAVDGLRVAMIASENASAVELVDMHE